MYELSRVLLKSVGPAGARYQDVLLDLSGVGRPVADDQLAFFGGGTAARRPSPATVLFLENGGGKSVLIKLIFSVVLPGRRMAVGAAGSGVLERFVLEGDTAHIVLEWTHVRSGRRLITGKVSEWKDLRPSSDSRNLVERWYHFRPNARLGLENLPISDSNRYVRLASYLDALRSALDDPAMEYAQFERHKEWTDRLTELGLDPELFRYQRSMNADEGEAAEAFSFTSDTAFVTFLLNAVLPAGPPRQLAELLETYAGQLGQRSQLVLERDFVEGALEILAKLATSRSAAETARRHRHHAARNMAVLLRQLHARAEAESESVHRMKIEYGQLTTDLAQEKKEHSAFCTTITELKRLVASLRLNEAIAEHQDAKREAALAATTAKAWQLTPLLLRQLTAEQRLKDARAVVAAAEQAAQPALIARDRAAARLAVALKNAVQALLRQSDIADQTAQEATGQAIAAQNDHNAAIGRAAKHESAAAAAEARIREVNDSIGAAIERGLLPIGTSVPTALEQASAAAKANSTRIAVLEAERDQLEHDQKLASDALQANLLRQAELIRAQDSAERDFTSATHRAEALRTDPAFGELLGYSADVLDTAADTLAVELTQVQEQATAAITKLQVADAQDQPKRLALETNELLPAEPEVVLARDSLRNEGITAWAGWEYLAAIPNVNRRRSLAEKVPHLAVGILLNDPEQLPQAQKLLSGSELHPLSYLPVGTTAAMTVEHTPPGGVDFVVPPHPALYDEQAADAERRQLQLRYRNRQQQLTVLSTRRDDAAALRARVQEWRREFPPGRLAELRELLAAADAQATAGAQEVASLQAALDGVNLRRTQVHATVKPLQLAQPRLDATVHQLTELAAQEARVSEWQATATREHTAADQERTAARTAAELAAEFRARAADRVRDADGHRASAARLTEEITGLGTIQPVERVSTEPPSEPLEVLRRSHKSASEAYLRASAGDQLMIDLTRAEHEADELTLELGDHPSNVVARARQLLDSPEGADHASREAARRLAELSDPEQASRAAESHAKLVVRREEYERFPAPPGEIDLTPWEPPRHISHGLRQITEATLARDRAALNVEEMGLHGTRLERSLAEAQETHRMFAKFHADWPEFADAEPAEMVDAPPPFPGDLAVAQTQHRAARSAYDEARRQAAAAQESERKEADRLARHAGQERFLLLRTASHKIMLNTDRGDLPGFAAEWADAMTRRLRSLVNDLSTIDRHRTQIVHQFAQQVGEALQILKRAQRFSALPKGLGDWSGQQFLRIKYDEVDEAVLRSRMAEIVDAAAEETMTAIAAGRELRRSGTSLILKGVTSAAEPKGFEVSILKPDSVLRTERVRVSELRSIFSGGQTLTTAIILYCTMAALRANDRGRMGNHHSGTLFLDNPIGRASATYLLRLQQSVATALGVQLVYTTGLFDTTALDVFPLVIRMRNDADLSAARKYLSVEEVFGRYLDEQLNGDDDRAAITATRYFIKEKGTNADSPE
ncbi:hypothetical protein ACFYST_18110 [Kitasatospora sp. NPDC004614]|uniref:hypothetical protein n=1 Tax=unclassified Kitasatospora TaxID=2633591 RepID=UPI0036759777